MSKQMLVNVTAEEENRVAIVDNGTLDAFEIETLSRENLKGNIYKVTVEGLNPALEAAFVNYGGERAGFLPLDELNFKIFPAREGGGKGRAARITRHLDKGMELMVQVVRDAFGNKPPTMSTYYSLPGRYLVLMPGADAGGISRKIENADERGRLRSILDSLTIPAGFGVIVRTAGMETKPRDLQADLESLVELWRTIEAGGQNVHAPALIYQERDLVIRTIRDYFTSDIEEILIDDDPTYRRAVKFFEAHMPDKVDLVRLYTGDRPIFSKHNVEDQIERIYKRVVQLKSGGSISIDQTEALTAVDVNSARSTRSAGSEETAARTNMEAAEEIARQLRLRDIGGLIVVDFIDMDSPKHRRQVERAFGQAMARDKARYDITRISKLGLLEVSRQRIKATKASSSFMSCPTCAGDGSIRTPEAAARAAYRKIQARVIRGDTSEVKVFLPPDVAMHLLNAKRDDLVRLESRYKVQVTVVPEERLKASQFEIEEIRREESEVAPVVTAETVDRAMAEGTIPPVIRPVEPPPEPIAVPPPSAEGRAAAVGEGPRRRRRRRGRRGRGDRPGPDQAAGPGGVTEGRRPAPAGGHQDETIAAAGGEERPVFSEGPEDEVDGPGEELSGPPDTRGRDPQPTGAETAGGRPGDGPGGRRRRRRRRRRGPRPVAEGGIPAGAVHRHGAHRVTGTGPGPSGNGSPAGPEPPPPAAWAEAPPLPPETHDRSWSAPGPDSSETHAPDPGGAAPDDATKPRRRWWRRPFRT
jgi:ribonuclease E